jgi:hypothetical protein
MATMDNIVRRAWQRSMIWLACRDDLRERIEGAVCAAGDAG